MISAIHKFEINPIQRSVNGVYSTKGGGNVLTFSLGATEQYLLPKSVHLNMRVRLRNGDGSRPANVPAQAITVDSRVSTISLIDRIMINTKDNRNLETARFMGRLASSVLPATKSFDDYTTYLSNLYGSVANSKAQDRIANRDLLVTHPLSMLGTFSGTPIPLSVVNGINGIEITLYLNSNPSCLFGTSASANGGSYFEIVECSLTGTLADVASGALPRIDGWSFTNYQGFYNTMTQKDETLAINAALKGVVSQFSNVIPTASLSNYSENEYNTPPLQNLNPAGTQYNVIAPVRNYDVLKNGVKYPLQFSQNANNIISQNAAGSYSESGYFAQRQRYFMDSIKRLNVLNNSLASPMSEALSSANPDDKINYQNYNDTVWGLGTTYDPLNVGATADFSQQPFSHRIRSLLDGRGNVSIYTWFYHKNKLMINKNSMPAVAN